MKIISLSKGYFVFILGLLLWCNHMHANHINPDSATYYWQSTVSGTVSDLTGPVPGVTVVNINTGIAAVSDDNGRYAIAALTGETLKFSLLGFQDQQQTVARGSLDVVLIEDVTQLQEVVVNAGYYGVKDAERTGSIARVTAKDLEGQPVSNVLATIQGRMAGVSVSQTTGVPGGGFDIQIRGQNSLRADGNAPLYIIDGVPYSSQTIGYDSATGVLPYPSNPLSSINPSDIFSIEILKDADATAIYGSRGANGVVLITTKKGKGGKTSFSGTVSTGMGSVTNFMKLLNTEQYLHMRAEAFQNDGTTPGASAYDVNGIWDEDRYTDWQEELLGGTAQYTDMQASVSGGSENTQFLVSGTFRKETTVFPGDFNYNRRNVRSNINHTSTDKRFSINFTAGYTIQDNDQPAVDLTRQAYNLAPNAPTLYSEDGRLNWENSTWVNPLAALSGNYLASTRDLLSSVLITYAVIPGLDFRTSLGYTDTDHNETRSQPSTIYDPAYGVGAEYSSVYANSTRRSSWIAEPQLSWQKEVGPVTASILVGSTFQQVDNTQRAYQARGFTSNSLIYNLSSASALYGLLDDVSIYKYNAVFGRVNLSYLGKYIINITGRRDGSSRFGPGRQFANFGALGVAWLFSKENFASGNILSFGKLRASYGTSGNDQIGDYQFLDTYAPSGTSYSGISGLQPTRLFNPDFAWETNKKLEVALEAGFLQDRIFVTGGFFSNRSSNQLVGIPLPSTTGFTSLQANLDATVENRGWEFTLRTVNFQSRDFNWITSINLTAVRNKLLSFPNLNGSTYRNSFVVGQSINIRKLYNYTGIDPETGIYTFEDINGDGSVTAAEDRSIVKDLSPKFFGGIQNSLSYKNWSLDFLFQFVKRLNYSPQANFGMPGTMSNQPQSVTDRWQVDDPAGSFQRYSSGTDALAADAYLKYTQSNAIITDASFIRLKNLAVAYTLPESISKNLRCRIFLEGQNLFTITPYQGADPEFNAIGYLPPLKVVSGGIQFSF